MVVIRRCIDGNWNLLSTSTIMSIYQITTLHTSKPTIYILFDTTINWNIFGWTRSMTNKNAKDMVSGIVILSSELSDIAPGDLVDVNSIHIKCRARVVNLVLKHCKKKVQNKIVKIRELAFVLRWPVQKTKSFRAYKKIILCELPNLDL